MDITEIVESGAHTQRAPELPPVVAGHESPVVVRKVEGFYRSVASMFEAWVARSENYHTRRCYTPHSLRATTATLLLKSGDDILEVQELLGHKNITTTQIYDKRVRQTRDSASHKISF